MKNECCHFEIIDENQHAVCQKCGAERDYPGWNEVPKRRLSVGGFSSIEINSQRQGVLIGRDVDKRRFG